MKTPKTPSTAELRRLAEAKLAAAGRRESQADLQELQVHQIELEMQNEALHESQAAVSAQLQRYADLYDFAPVGYFTLESDGAIRELNLSGAQLLWAERSRLVGRRFGMFVAEASRSKFSRFLEEVFATNEKRTCDVDLASDRQPPRAVTIEATLTSDGRGCRAVVMDLTERKRAEDGLHASDARFRVLVDAIHDYAIFLLDPEGRVASWNSGAQALKGYAAAEIIGQHFSVFYPPEERERGKPEHELIVAAAEGRFEEEGWRLRKDGSRFWASVTIAAVRDAKGSVVNYAKVTRDLSESRAAAQRRVELLVRSAPDGVIVMDVDGRVVHANPQAATLFGYTTEELLSLDQDQLVPERLRVKHRAHRAKFAEAPSVRTIGAAAAAVFGLRKDGTEFPAEIGLSPLQTPEGHLVIAFIRDVTALRRLEQAQARTADRLARLQAITAALAEPIGADDVAAFILSTSFEVVGANAGLVARSVENGRQVEILREGGKRYAPSFVSSPGPEVVGGRLRLSIDTRAPLSDAMRSRSAVWLESPAEIRALYPAYAPVLEQACQRAAVCLPLVSRDELIGGLRLSFSEERTFDARDRALLTAFAFQCALALDRAQLYEEALAARVLADRATMMRDEFLSIVAHDLGNPLNAIGLWARLLGDSAPAGAEGEEARNGASKILNGVRRMALLLHDLGDVASIDSGRLSIKKQQGNAQAIVADIVEAYAPLCVEKELSISGDAPALRIPCDPNRVQQVLGNLVANAIKFTPTGGAIIVEAVPSGGDLRFSVADTGPGIPREACEHVFERYWRGKERDFTKGVGLGLFIAKGIVDSHGGNIWVESTVGRGSTFYFTLPLGSP